MIELIGGWKPGKRILFDEYKWGEWKIVDKVVERVSERRNGMVKMRRRHFVKWEKLRSRERESSHKVCLNIRKGKGVKFTTSE